MTHTKTRDQYLGDALLIRQRHVQYVNYYVSSIRVGFQKKYMTRATTGSASTPSAGAAADAEQAKHATALFIGPNGRRYEDYDALPKVTAIVIGARITATALRKILTTYAAGNLSAEEQTSLARADTHSALTARRYYEKRYAAANAKAAVSLIESKFGSEAGATATAAAPQLPPPPAEVEQPQTRPPVLSVEQLLIAMAPKRIVTTRAGNKRKRRQSPATSITSTASTASSSASASGSSDVRANTSDSDDDGADDIDVASEAYDRLPERSRSRSPSWSELTPIATRSSRGIEVLSAAAAAIPEAAASPSSSSLSAAASTSSSASASSSSSSPSASASASALSARTRAKLVATQLAATVATAPSAAASFYGTGDVQLPATIGDGVEVKTSGIPNAGLGLWATRAFSKGSLVSEYDGEVISHSEAIKRSVAGVATHIKSLDPLHLCIDGRDLKATSVGRGGASFVNDPYTTPYRRNAVFVTKQGVKGSVPRLGYDSLSRCFLQATRAIAPGEEIFVWYGDSYFLADRGL